MKPLCFVLMPFGKKPDGAGRRIDFDRVYEELIGPAIADAELEPLRADVELTGGIIHKPMFERLMLCDYAVADLTAADANVFYELGVRQAVRSWRTVLLFAEGGSQLPFDVARLRALPYRLASDGALADVERSRRAVADRLREARRASTDSPVFQLVESFPDIQRLKTDVFRERVRYAEGIKNKLASARRQGVDAVRAVEKELGPLDESESGVVIDLLLSYRAANAWTDMIDLVARMPRPLAASVLVREQLGLALNRAGRSEEAERTIVALLEDRGPSSETCAILGRIYKDRWEKTTLEGDSAGAHGLLDEAIAAYLRGFETDWRDAYPGVNAVTLMELKQPRDPRQAALLPVVRYAVERRLASAKPDYWDHATLLELAVLGGDERASRAALADALAIVREPWEPETTARNLRLIREAREARGERLDWAGEIEQTLLHSAGASG